MAKRNTHIQVLRADKSPFFYVKNSDKIKAGYVRADTPPPTHFKNIKILQITIDNGNISIYNKAILNNIGGTHYEVFN